MVNSAASFYPSQLIELGLSGSLQKLGTTFHRQHQTVGGADHKLREVCTIFKDAQNLASLVSETFRSPNIQELTKVKPHFTCLNVAAAILLNLKDGLLNQFWVPWRVSGLHTSVQGRRKLL